MAVEWKTPTAKTCHRRWENTRRLENVGFTLFCFQLNHNGVTVQDNIIIPFSITSLVHQYIDPCCLLLLKTYRLQLPSSAFEDKILKSEKNKWKLKTKGPEKPKNQTAGDR